MRMHSALSMHIAVHAEPVRPALPLPLGRLQHLDRRSFNFYGHFRIKEPTNDTEIQLMLILKMNATWLLAALLAVLSCTVTQVLCLSFMLPPNVKKCLQEEIHKDVLVTGDYKLSGAPGHKTLLLVSDSKGHILYTKDDAVEGKFAFTSDDYDTFEICFTTHLPAGMRGADREVYLNVKRGVEAKSYEDIAKSEALKPMEVELRRLEDLSEAIVNDFAYMKAREEEMRDTNESTNTRVLYFSIFSMVCLLSLATWQVFYLRRYFKSKKLIE